jgi:glycyl-radical enzyme activating protein family
MEYCIQGARELVGGYMEPGDLINELKKDTVFYEESGGGITLSGGEVMTVDSEYLHQVMEPLHRQGYNLGIDTCGYAPFEQFEKVLPYIDFFLYDIKLIDNKKHKLYTGVSNDLILNNIKLLSEAGAKIYLRIPVIEQVNATIEEMKSIIDFLKEHRIRIIKVYLLPYHPMGKSKHERLQMIYQNDFEVPDHKKMEELQGLFEQNGYTTVIGG